MSGMYDTADANAATWPNATVLALSAFRGARGWGGGTTRGHAVTAAQVARE